jgi:hypothetical protein
MSSPQILKMAICLVPHAASLDFIGPMDVLGLLVQQNIDPLNEVDILPKKLDPAVRIEPAYFSASKDPVIVTAGPPVHADKTYDEEGLGQYDIILVPGGECRLLGGCVFWDLKLCCPDQAHSSRLRLLWTSSSENKHLEPSTLCPSVLVLTLLDKPDC